jgi:uncharacterized membrane protein
MDSRPDPRPPNPADCSAVGTAEILDDGPYFCECASPISPACYRSFCALVRSPADRLFHHDFGILSTMHTDNGDELEPTIFSATLTPHRSIGRIGFLILMVVFGLASFITGMLFLVLGAWPVFGFCGLDALLLYWAFRLNYRHAEAYEQVTVTCSELRVRKVSHLGGVREWVLNPLWVKLDKSEIEDFGIDRLFLISRGKKLSIASFLSPEEKADFARELGKALNEARRGPTRTVLD